MTRTELEITTRDRVATVWASRPDGAGPWPGVLMLTDAFGVREAALGMADHLASYGYYVLLPDLFYRLEPAAFDPKAVFGNSPDAAAWKQLMQRLEAVDADAPGAMTDFERYFDTLAGDPEVRGSQFGVVGYCMGGGLALRAACSLPARIAAAASIHGGRFVTDPRAPDEIAAKLRAAVHIAVAETDRWHTAEVSRQLEAALTRAGVRHQVEVYPGSSHGFAVPDTPVYDRASAEHHWERVVELFRSTIG